MKVLPCTWTFYLKRFPDSLIKKFKARFCVRGDCQVEGIDFFETWAPVVQWSTVRTIGQCQSFLGVDIKRLSTGTSHQIQLTQAGLTKQIVEALGLCPTTSTAISTPAKVAPLLQIVNSDPASGHFNYAAIIGMLLYLSGHSRPDIAFPVHQCA
ncbi:hypothetical protein ACHAW6_005324 [Cyclotella cf. meneghiniana]